MIKLARTLSFCGHVIVESRGIVGGFAVFWTEERDVDCLWTTERSICYMVKCQGYDLCWKLIGVYGTPYRRDKVEFWKWLEDEVAN